MGRKEKEQRNGEYRKGTFPDAVRAVDTISCALSIGLLGHHGPSLRNRRTTMVCHVGCLRVTSPSFHDGDACISSLMEFKLTTLGYTGKPSSFAVPASGQARHCVNGRGANQDLSHQESDDESQCPNANLSDVGGVTECAS